MKQSPVFLTIFSICLLAASALGENFFVNPVNGTDSLTCGPILTPCATFPYAINKVVVSKLATNETHQLFLAGNLHNLTENANIQTTEAMSNVTLTISPLDATQKAVLRVEKVDATVLVRSNGVSVVFQSIQFENLQTAIKSSSSASFKGCTFTKGKASLHVESPGVVLLESSEFVEQGPSSVSFVRVSAGASLVAHSTKFSQNVNENGHTLLAEAGSQVILGSVFFGNNTVAANSTGVFNVKSKSVAVTSSTFDQNVGGNGAAIYVEEEAFLTLSTTNFTGNSAHGSGGAVFVNGGQIEFSDVLFSKNSAAVSGGALYFSNGPQSEKIVVTRANFTQNSHGNQANGSFGTDIWMRSDIQPSFTNLTAAQSSDSVYCAPTTPSNSTLSNGTVVNQYCTATCRAPQCSLCIGLCVLDNRDSYDASGSGDCFSLTSISCNNHGSCRLYHPSGKDSADAQCECDATYAAPSCASRSWLFYVLILLAVGVAAIVVVGGIFTIQNRVRNGHSTGYSTLN